MPGRVSISAASVDASTTCLPAAWEGLFLEQIGAIRAREATYIRRMARVKACNNGLSYAIAPLVSRHRRRRHHRCRVSVCWSAAASWH